MKYDELIKILKEKVTDDMFEALVMNKIFYSLVFKVLACDTSFDNLKIYTIQEHRTGKEFYVVINHTCKKLDKNLFPDDKYMIANKDEDTLFYLANELNGRPHKNFPVNLRWLIPILEDFEEDFEDDFEDESADAEEIKEQIKAQAQAQIIEQLRQETSVGETFESPADEISEDELPWFEDDEGIEDEEVIEDEEIIEDDALAKLKGRFGRL